ncbi:MAG: asparagine synthetase A [Bacteroidales bacterium]|nr:asparagine synthetase A [Bacteroidales bacterium]
MKKIANYQKELKSSILHLQRKELQKILKVQSEIIRAIHNFTALKGIINVPPLMLSPVTDPLSHSVYNANIEYAGNKFSLMKSMIFHKQLLMTNENIDSIYIVSPNVRLETKERKNTGKHLFEFTQIDFEFKNKDREFFLNFMEELIVFIFRSLNINVPKELLELRGSLLKIPGSFKRYTSGELKKKYGEDFEKIASEKAKEPFWIFDHKREFYDKEDMKNRGHYINYDIIWPEGFGEALSGGEREYEYKNIVRKMEENKNDKEQFKYYLKVARSGILKPSAGGGLGLERITRFVTKIKDIADITAFNRKPFSKIIF